MRNIISTKVKSELDAVTSLCLMFDGWTDRYYGHHNLGSPSVIQFVMRFFFSKYKLNVIDFLMIFFSPFGDVTW